MLFELQRGIALGISHSKKVTNLGKNTFELRVKDTDGICYEKFKKAKVDKTPYDLAESLDLNPSVVIEWEVAQYLVEQIIKVFNKNKPTVTEIAKKSGTSRARIAQILKGSSAGISINVLLRVLL